MAHRGLPAHTNAPSPGSCSSPRHPTLLWKGLHWHHTETSYIINQSTNQQMKLYLQKKCFSYLRNLKRFTIKNRIGQYINKSIKKRENPVHPLPTPLPPITPNKHWSHNQLILIKVHSKGNLRPPSWHVTSQILPEPLKEHVVKASKKHWEGTSWRGTRRALWNLEKPSCMSWCEAWRDFSLLHSPSSD